MTAEELHAWLHLLQSLSRGACRRLLARFGDPQAALAAGPAGWLACLKPEQVEALQQGPAQLPALVDRTLAWLDQPGPRGLMVLGDPDYPPALLATADPPLLLYLEGRRELMSRRSLALVGSRRPSAQGRDNARAFARQLGDAGLCIVSGLALGIDGAAHEGALETQAGTIAFLGTGLDQVYPRQHLGLARRIAEQGLLASEYPLGTPPLAHHFPQRNRLIAGVSLGCLVVEAATRSGSLITARLAAEAGREVFAIPGSIHSEQSRGCHELLKQGACLAAHPDDVLAELPQAVPRSGELFAARPEARTAPGTVAKAKPETAAKTDARTDAETDAETPLLRALGHDPVTLEQLSQRSGWPLDQLSAALLEMELAGQVARLPGALFQRRAGG